MVTVYADMKLTFILMIALMAAQDSVPALARAAGQSRVPVNPPVMSSVDFPFFANEVPCLYFE